MKPVLFLQNITLEPPGLAASFLKKRNIPYEIIDLYINEAIQHPPGYYGAVVILGGPMNVDDEDKYPYLREEKDFIRQCYKQRVPTLGLCLGSQLMAAVAGAPVRKNEVPEIGWMEVELNENGRECVLFEGIDSPVPVFQWHGDTFALPDGATHLASSSNCRNQAFMIHENSFGLQFHIEVNEEDAKEWALAYWDDVSDKMKPEVQELIDHPNQAKAQIVAAVSERLFFNFFCKVGKYNV